MDVLAEGHAAAVVSEYAKDGTISKQVIIESDADIARTGADVPGDAVTDGPVTHFYSEGGDLTVIEHYLPRPRLIIIGGGHIALALTVMAKACEFYTVVYDDRPMFANEERFPAADEVICDDFSRLFERVRIREADYVVIVTRGHKHDQECLEGVLQGERPAYTGMIGSRRRVAIVMKQLAKAGYPKERLDEVYTPIGLRIGAVTPAEISVSILAELIEVKRVKNVKGDGSTVFGDVFTNTVEPSPNTVEPSPNTKPVALSSDTETAAKLAESGDQMDALITILETHGSVPRETGAKMGMSYEGSIIGTIGGGCAESGVMQEARTVIREGGWRTVTVDMTDSAEEDGMVCGGTMTALIEQA
jgi:xanthine dehydrogenase accessory factor